MMDNTLILLSTDRIRSIGIFLPEISPNDVNTVFFVNISLVLQQFLLFISSFYFISRK
ncbi:hypothetical protein JCM19237_6456 [Photobacterium aphoticum]|uniref:Uncharacterized protein n=1 Tax=Photobacterium aphoticum TaxID=754436 RepID=A0A090R7H0_9GAMM|nr:hypothetical protein JCM19237_6456 [Photobacterium aphoticum]